MKRIIASILAAGAASLAIAGTANAAELYGRHEQEQAQVQVQPTYYGYGNYREHERLERIQARRRLLERQRHERMERMRERGVYGNDRW